MRRIACFGLLVVVLGLVTSACASSTQSGSSPTPASTATRAPSASPNGGCTLGLGRRTAGSRPATLRNARHGSVPPTE